MLGFWGDFGKGSSFFAFFFDICMIAANRSHSNCFTGSGGAATPGFADSRPWATPWIGPRCPSIPPRWTSTQFATCRGKGRVQVGKYTFPIAGTSEGDLFLGQRRFPLGDKPWPKKILQFGGVAGRVGRPPGPVGVCAFHLAPSRPGGRRLTPRVGGGVGASRGRRKMPVGADTAWGRRRVPGRVVEREIFKVGKLS